MDAATGKTVQTYTATAGEQVLRIGMLTTADSRSPRGGSGNDSSSGFDGIGGVNSAYAPAQVCC